MITRNSRNLANAHCVYARACAFEFTLTGGKIQFSSGCESTVTVAMSLNPGKTSAYTEDLRWRIVWQREALELDLKTVAGNLGVHPSTVSRVVRLFRDTGSEQKRICPSQTHVNVSVHM